MTPEPESSTVLLLVFPAFVEAGLTASTEVTAGPIRRAMASNRSLRAVSSTALPPGSPRARPASCGPNETAAAPPRNAQAPRARVVRIRMGRPVPETGDVNENLPRGAYGIVAQAGLTSAQKRARRRKIEQRTAA